MTRHSRAGFTLVETLIVIVVMGLALMFMVPRLRVSPQTKARAAASLLAADLELARSKAMAYRSLVRVVFDASTSSYTGYLDINRDGVIDQSIAERDSLKAFGGIRRLSNDAVYGRAGQPDVPDFYGAGAITFPAPEIDFDARGLTTPLGTRGVIYVREFDDSTAVAAVSVSGAGGVRIWTTEGGNWR